jgi:hypothetical protein
MREWNEEIYPHRVVPLLARLTAKAGGPGRIVGIMPGVRIWIPEDKQKEITNDQGQA